MSRAHGAAVLVMSLLAVGILFDLVAAGSGLAQVSLLRSAAAGRTLSHEEAVSNDTRQAAIGVFQVLIFLITATCFLIWVHRAYKSLQDLGRPSDRFSPGWAVGYWFIPFINLVRPYQIMKELWLRSAERPAADRTETPMFKTLEEKAPSLIGWWWGVWLISGILGRVVMSEARSAKSLPELITMSWTLIGSDLFGIVSALLAISVVRGIDRLQGGVSASGPAVP